MTLLPPADELFENVVDQIALEGFEGETPDVLLHATCLRVHVQYAHGDVPGDLRGYVRGGASACVRDLALAHALVSVCGLRLLPPRLLCMAALAGVGARAWCPS